MTRKKAETDEVATNGATPASAEAVVREYVRRIQDASSALWITAKDRPSPVRSLVFSAIDLEEKYVAPEYIASLLKKPDRKEEAASQEEAIREWIAWAEKHLATLDSLKLLAFPRHVMMGNPVAGSAALRRRASH